MPKHHHKIDTDEAVPKEVLNSTMMRKGNILFDISNNKNGFFIYTKQKASERC